MPYTQKRKAYTLHFPPEKLEAIQAAYARTYPEHRKSFQQWCIDKLLEGIEVTE